MMMWQVVYFLKLCHNPIRSWCDISRGLPFLLTSWIVPQSMMIGQLFDELFIFYSFLQLLCVNLSLLLFTISSTIEFFCYSGFELNLFISQYLIKFALFHAILSKHIVEILNKMLKKCSVT